MRQERSLPTKEDKSARALKFLRGYQPVAGRGSAPVLRVSVGERTKENLPRMCVGINAINVATIVTESISAILDEVTLQLWGSSTQNVALKDEQRMAINYPTGFCKSLIYQYFGIDQPCKQNCRSNVSTLVIFPLSSIVKYEFAGAESLGITECCLKDLLDFKVRRQCILSAYLQKTVLLILPMYNFG